MSHPFCVRCRTDRQSATSALLEVTTHLEAEPPSLKPAELESLLGCRSEKTRKLRELHEELTTLDTDIQQVAAQAGAPSAEGAPRAPERPSDAELLRRRIAETADRPVGPCPLPALPGLPGALLHPTMPPHSLQSLCCAPRRHLFCTTLLLCMALSDHAQQRRVARAISFPQGLSGCFCCLQA